MGENDPAAAEALMRARALIGEAIELFERARKAPRGGAERQRLTAAAAAAQGRWLEHLPAAAWKKLPPEEATALGQSLIRLTIGAHLLMMETVAGMPEMGLAFDELLQAMVQELLTAAAAEDDEDDRRAHLAELRELGEVGELQSALTVDQVTTSFAVSVLEIRDLMQARSWRH